MPVAWLSQNGISETANNWNKDQQKAIPNTSLGAPTRAPISSAAAIWRADSAPRPASGRGRESGRESGRAPAGGGVKASRALYSICARPDAKGPKGRL